MDKFQLSDHQPQVLEINDQLSVMTWNILKRCTYYEQPRKFFNNGFGIIETEYEYHVRLKKIASEIHTILVNDTTIKCIALQEMPIESDLELFKSCLSELLPNFSLITNKTQGFLFDKQYMTIEDRTSHLISSIGKNPHKLQLINTTTPDGEIQFINIHLCWFKSYNTRLEALKSIIRTLDSKAIILGDFNFNILDVEIDGVEKYAEPNTTLCNGENGIQNLQTCDGFLIYDR